VWTWTAIDADTKLVPCFMVGDRGLDTATAFIEDLASRLTNRVQLTTDGHRAYLEAIEEHSVRTLTMHSSLCRAPEPNDENEHAEIYETDQCILEKD
jgi:transposase-like protein